MNTSGYHNKNNNCSKTNARRLYIRDYAYNKKGKKIQDFKEYGITCLTCGLMLKVDFVSLGLDGVPEDRFLARQEKRRNLRAREKLNKQFAKYENKIKTIIPDPKFHKRIDKIVERRKERLK